MRKFEGFQKGVNLGGWISQFRKYDKAHFDSYITEEDIRRIKDFGFDHVRCPVDYIVLEDEAGNVREDGFAYLEQCRQWCEKYGLNMIIDLHECYGYSFDPLKKDDKKQFFYNEKDQERFLKLCWNKLLAKYVARMRAIAPDTYLVIGGVCYNSVGTIALLDFPLDDHIVYNFHCYEPMVFTHQGAHWVDCMPADFRIGYPKTLEEYQKASTELSQDLAGAIFEDGISEIGPKFFEDIFTPAIEKAKANDIPLYCGEHGVIDLADREDALRWIRDIHATFHKYSIGSALWNYKGMDYGISDMKNVKLKEGLREVL